MAPLAVKSARQRSRLLPAIRPVLVVSKCKTCGVVDRFEVPRAGLKARRKGTTLVDAFPGMDPRRIRQLSDHVCPGCQDKESKKDG